MQSYLNAKLILFKKILSKGKTIISDNSIKEFSILKKISKRRNLKLIDTDKIKNSIKKNLNQTWSKFQLSNLTMAIAAAKLKSNLQMKKSLILFKIKDVDGRLELVRIFQIILKYTLTSHIHQMH